MSQNFFSILGATLASILVFASSGNASVFYHMEFFDENDELVGTGQFSHEDEPLDEIISLCTTPAICGNDSSFDLEIKEEDNFFRLDSFSSTIPGLSEFSSVVDLDNNGDLFWRPFDEEKVASTSFCPSGGCFQVLSYNSSSWFLNGRIFGAFMSATRWSVDGGDVLPSGSGTWTATRKTSIPEPASVLGLMTIGILGVGSKLKRKK